MKSGKTQSLVTALLTAGVVIVCINTWLALRSVRILNLSQSWVAHTWQVLNAIEHITGSLKDAENGNRGYLITGQQEYLAPYMQARNDLPAEIDSLRQITSDNPKQQPRVDEMRAVIAARLNLLQNGIDERDRGGATAASALVLTGTGKSEMDHLRAIAGSMQDEERRLLAERTHTAQANRIEAESTIVVAGLLDLLLVIVTFWYLARERQLRAIADANADRLNKLQSISDVALTQLSSSELTSELLERVRRVVRADATTLAILKNGELVLADSVGGTIEAGTVIPMEADEAIRAAIDHGQIVAVGGAGESRPEFGDLRRGMSVMLVVPLTISGSVTGVLIAGRAGVPSAAANFDEQDEQLLSVVADRIAVSLARASAYEAEHEARRLAETSADQVRLLNADLEERVRLRTAELEATNRELEAFSFSVSHDLRAPLRTVDGFSLALEEDYRESLDVNGRDFIRRIRNGVQRMGQLIDTLLQLSRITRAELNNEVFNISLLASSVAEQLRAENPDRDLEFIIQPDLVLDADPRMVRIALENLLGNSVKFTANVPKAVIEFGRGAAGEFYIRDNGAGFDMQYAGKLFTAFQRLHGDKDFKGSGIGLATVARVIHRHHGTISAEAAVGSGATFRFTLG